MYKMHSYMRCIFPYKVHFVCTYNASVAKHGLVSLCSVVHIDCIKNTDILYLHTEAYWCCLYVCVCLYLCVCRVFSRLPVSSVGSKQSS